MFKTFFLFLTLWWDLVILEYLREKGVHLRFFSNTSLLNRYTVIHNNNMLYIFTIVSTVRCPSPRRRQSSFLSNLCLLCRYGNVTSDRTQSVSHPDRHSHQHGQNHRRWIVIFNMLLSLLCLNNQAGMIGTNYISKDFHTHNNMH